MKKILLICALFIGFQGFSKQIPGPSILFSISDKILAQAQQLLFPSFEKTAVKPIKGKAVIRVKSKVPLKVEEPVVPEKTPTESKVKVERDGIWITTDPQN